MLLFYGYIVLLILLPTGSVFGVNVKLLAFLPLLFGALNRMAREDYPLNSMSWNLFVLCAFFAWAFLYLFQPINEPALAFSQFKDVVTTLAGCWIIRLFATSDREKFIRVCIFAMAFAGFLKVFIFGYAFMAGIPVSAIVEGISKQFGVVLMSLDMGDFGGRISFVSDTLLPICIFALLCLRNRLGITAFQATVALVFLLVSDLYTFARFTWGYTAVAIALAFVVSQKDRMHKWYIAACVAVVAYLSQAIFATIAFRFSLDLMTSSDDLRVWQIKALKEFFWDAPFFGHGLGSHPNLIRSDITPYSYEVQILAVVGQVGLIGSALFLVILFNYYRKSFNFSENKRYQLAVLILIVCFIANGFFNPSLLSSASAVNFGLLFMLASLNPRISIPGSGLRVDIVTVRECEEAQLTPVG